MSIAARVRNYVNFTGDVENELVYDSGDLSSSPFLNELLDLSSGNNSIDVPDIEGWTTHGFALVPPELNEVEPVLKGANGDTGITLAANQVSIIQFGATPPATIVLNVDEEVVGFRLIWF